MKPPRPLPRFLGWFSPFVLLALFPVTAQAHVFQGETGGFASGFEHPWSGWDHILAMVAVGIWGAQLGQPAIWLLPVTFPIVMSFGGFMGLVGIPLPGVEIGIALSALFLGVMVCGELRPPVWVAAFMVGIFGLFHGYAHGRELPPGESGLLFSIGFVIATGTLHGAGIAIGLIHRWKFGRYALRVGGAVIAVAGIYFLVHALSPQPPAPGGKTARATLSASTAIHPA